MKGNSFLQLVRFLALVPKPGPKRQSTWFSVAVLKHPPPQTQRMRIPLWSSVVLYLQNRLHIGADESGGIGDQMSQHAGTLLLDSPNATVLQLCQNLQGRKVSHYGRGWNTENCVKGDVSAVGEMKQACSKSSLYWTLGEHGDS